MNVGSQSEVVLLRGKVDVSSVFFVARGAFFRAMTGKGWGDDERLLGTHPRRPQTVFGKCRSLECPGKG